MGTAELGEAMVEDMAAKAVISEDVVTPLVIVHAVTAPVVTAPAVAAAAVSADSTLVAAAIAIVRVNVATAVQVYSALAFVPDSAPEKITRPMAKGLYKDRERLRTTTRCGNLKLARSRTPPFLSGSLLYFLYSWAQVHVHDLHHVGHICRLLFSHVCFLSSSDRLFLDSRRHIGAT